VARGRSLRTALAKKHTGSSRSFFHTALENARLFVDLSSFSGHMPTQKLSNFRGFFLFCLVFSISRCIETRRVKKILGIPSLFFKPGILGKGRGFSENAWNFLKRLKLDHFANQVLILAKMPSFLRK
jgi:hypothetical protein